MMNVLQKGRPSRAALDAVSAARTKMIELKTKMMETDINGAKFRIYLNVLAISVM
jgi:pyrimidine operon attenuation protein/uracil phosphoribosyltransferase